MKRILIHKGTIGAGSWYRAVNPWKECKILLAAEGIHLELSDHVPRPTLGVPYPYDAVLLRGVPEVDFFEKIQAIANKAKIFYDMDDCLWEIPEWSPARSHYGKDVLDRLDKCLGISSGVVVSEPYLGQYINGKFPDFPQAVCPNLVRVADWDRAPFDRREEEGDPPKLVWAGGNTHQGDIDLLWPWLQGFCTRTGSTAHFIGLLPSSCATFFAKPGDTFASMGSEQSYVKFHEQVGLAEYPTKLRTFANAVGVVPLVDCVFNHCKSNIKRLEYTMAGIATDDLVNTMGWYTRHEEEVNNMVSDRDHRFARWSRAQEQVQDCYTWNVNSQKDKWLNAFREMVS